MQDLDLDKVKEEGKDGDREHYLSNYLRWVEEALRCFVDQPGRHDPDRENRTERANDLYSVIAESVSCVCFAVCYMQSAD